MSIWSTIVANPDAVIGLVTALAGAIGIGRWRKHVRQSTLNDIDRWANTVAAGVVLAIRSGAFKAHEDAMSEALWRFRTLASAAGVAVLPSHEARALTTMHRALVAAGQESLLDEQQKLHALATATMQRLSKLPWPGDKP